MNLRAELEFALSLADTSGALVLKHFGTNLKVEWKGDATPVTLADRAAEEAMRTRIAKETPDYAVLGEEFGNSPGSAGREWVIDPIDGTKAFMHGVPLFGTLIALLEDGEPVLGVIDLPALGERVHATLGGGCFRNGSPCRVSSVERLEEALILDGSPTTMERMGYGKASGGLRERARLHRRWGDCYGHFLVATGSAEVMADPVVEIWDIAPLAVIIPEAGGRFTSFAGNRSIRERSAISSNGKFHDEVVKELRITNYELRVEGDEG
jgi:histidinol-phosphatase